MPNGYETLVSALKLTDIPFQEYGWKTRPEGMYGIVSLDMEAGSLDGNGLKLDRTWEASVDVFWPKLVERNDIVNVIEEILTETCGSAWRLNLMTYEHGTGLFHAEWVCEVQNTQDGDA